MAREINEVAYDFFTGVTGLCESDQAYLLDKIEEARWTAGPDYNPAVHKLLDVIQYCVENKYNME